MKSSRFVLLSASVVLCFNMVSCNNAYQSTNRAGDGRFGPPRAIPTDDPEMYGPEIIPGRYLQTISPSSVFFSSYPSIEDQPDRILPNYTDVKVVSVKGVYVKVELIDTGAVGYVPSIMLGEKRSRRNSPRNAPKLPNSNEQLVPDIGPGLTDPSRPAE
ncbi:MAG: hypothetical protein P8P36_03605 [Akkermansiaceae bacterium]|nr:hypothetical protein [Akkermansiaceae bacterium]